MNEAAQRVRTNQSQQPENEQNNRKRVQHNSAFLYFIYLDLRKNLSHVPGTNKLFLGSHVVNKAFAVPEYHLPSKDHSISFTVPYFHPTLLLAPATIYPLIACLWRQESPFYG